jgi:prevent-host-death family protein
MKTMSISEARSRLPAIVGEVAQSHSPLVVTRYGEPVVAIVPYEGPVPPGNPHPLRGHEIAVTDDFDHPMPDIWEALAVAEEHADYTSGDAEAKE